MALFYVKMETRGEKVSVLSAGRSEASVAKGRIRDREGRDSTQRRKSVPSRIYSYRKYAGIELIRVPRSQWRAHARGRGRKRRDNVVESFDDGKSANKIIERARRAATSPDSSGQLAPSGDEVKPSGKLQSPFSSFPPGAAFSPKTRFP